MVGKNKKSKLYVIPGMGESTRAMNYRELIRFARKAGFIVVPVNIDWSSKLDMSGYISQVDQKIPNNINSDYILGFSFGAYIASVLADKKQAKGYVFCSISPYFKENLRLIPKESKKYWGVKMMKSFSKYEFPLNGKGVAWFYMGDKDWNIAKDAVKIFYKKWKDKKTLNYIKDAGHELSHSQYLKKLKELIKML